jgi:hypothetical protein
MTRHTFIAWALSEGANLKGLAEYCGTSVQMIEQSHAGTRRPAPTPPSNGCWKGGANRQSHAFIETLVAGARQMGRNLGTASVSLTFSNTTSTLSPIRSLSGS